MMTGDWCSNWHISSPEYMTICSLFWKTLNNRTDTLGHFTFWISLSLRPKTETIPLNFGLSPEFRLSNHCGAHHCSVHSVIANVIADISVFLCYRPSEMRLLYFSTVGFFLFFLSVAFPARLTSDCHNQYQYRKVVEVAVIWNMTRLKILPMWGVSPKMCPKLSRKMTPRPAKQLAFKF